MMPKINALNYKIISNKIVFESFYKFSQLNYQHERFDGCISREIQRDLLLTGDASVLLPYDPRSDMLLLIEQIRAAPIARSAANPYHIEAIAGLIDKNEHPEATARREAFEEAGIEIEQLYTLPSSYQSAGAIDQVQHLFIGKANLSDYKSGIHGLIEEDEDIKTHLVSRHDALQALTDHKFESAPLQLILLYLEFNIKKIRAAFA